MAVASRPKPALISGRAARTGTVIFGALVVFMGGVFVAGNRSRPALHRPIASEALDLLADPSASAPGWYMIDSTHRQCVSNPSSLKDYYSFVNDEDGPCTLKKVPNAPDTYAILCDHYRPEGASKEGGGWFMTANLSFCRFALEHLDE